MEPELLVRCESLDRSDSLEGKNDTKQMSVPSLHLLTSLIYSHQCSLHHIATKLKELLQNQEVLVEGMESENERFKIAGSTFNLSTMFQEMSTYNQKLIQLKSEMTSITERTSCLKKRAMRLQQQQQLKALNQEQERARQAEREKHLIARPVWATQQDDP